MPPSASRLSQEDAEQVVARAHANLLPEVGNWNVKPELTKRFAFGWMVVVGPADGIGCGLGPYFVTDTGDVFASGSAYPPEQYAEDMAVMTRPTRNPLRYLRYLARRVFDGRTPRRVQPNHYEMPRTR